jgi:crotonobetainyl-CoA:carnitine CoA-transferase CaiB-like acyl-CoA transferase
MYWWRTLRPEPWEDESLADNNKRIAARSRLLLLLNGIFGRLSLEEALRLAAAADLAYAPVSKPGDLLHDSHLQSTGSLLSTVLGDGSRALLPRQPMMMNHRGFGLRNSPPAVGADTAALLQELGVGGRMQSLRDKGVVGGPLNVPQPAAAAKPAEAGPNASTLSHVITVADNDAQS